MQVKYICLLRWIILILFALPILLVSCTSNQVSTVTTSAERLILHSNAFNLGAKIPEKYTCQGENISPPLSWNITPAGTQSFAIVAEDIDGPNNQLIITHWIIFNIPADSHELAEAIPVQGQLANGVMQGNNIGGKSGYTGPCPPSGTHRYDFTLFALDTKLNLSSGIDRSAFLAAMRGHILAVAQTMGIFYR